MRQPPLKTQFSGFRPDTGSKFWFYSC